jgi:hypothetical protein
MLILLAILSTIHAPESACAYDRQQMLALDQRAFDQDMNGGWRALSRREGCALAAADLIRDYRQSHRLSDTILYWHEGQLRASAGQTETAIALFEQSRTNPDDGYGWNAYVDATIAFLRVDRPALLAAREALARLPMPAGFAPVDTEGRPLQIRWPMNMDVVDALVACFGSSYSEAYGGACRALAPRNRPER